MDPRLQRPGDDHEPDMTPSPPFRFCFTLDTEPDDLWANRGSLGFEHFRRLAGFHERLAGAGARCTFLTTSEVAEDTGARKAVTRCMESYPGEIGAHVHTWTRSWPFSIPDLGSPPLHAMAHRLGQEVEEAMLAHTCETLRRAFDVKPTSHRGGRWSLGPDSARSLGRCGIRVDSTATPGQSWADGRHPLLDGPDYGRWPREPSLLSEILGPGDGRDGVLEIPVGAAWIPPFSRRMPPLLHRAWSRLGKVVGLPLGYRWLRPTHTPLRDMVATLRQLKADGVPAWVIMIHSSEIAPCTPLPREEDVALFVERCVGIVEAAVQLGAEPSTLTEAADAFLTAAGAAHA